MDRRRAWPSPSTQPRTSLALRVLVAFAFAAHGPAALAKGDAVSESDVRPNVVIISIDTLRADHTSVYGHTQDTTPRLAELAKGGVVFDPVYAPTSQTGPSHASLFTGLHVSSHGLAKNGQRLASRHETLAEVLSANGYQTAGVASSFVLNARFGWSQGFETWEDDFDVDDASVDFDVWEGVRVDEPFDQRADATTRRAVRWVWERDRDRPFLLFVHYFDPHSPYSPPKPFERRFELPARHPRGGARASLVHRLDVRRYDGEIAFVDREIGRLLDVLASEGLRDDTLVVISADHGEGLRDHGHMLHGLQIYEEVVRVPLLMSWPGTIPAGAQIEGPVELVDVAPTLIALLGLDVDAGFEGRDLGAAVRDGAALDPGHAVRLHRRAFDDAVMDGIHVDGEQFGLRVGRWKYIEGRDEYRSELYDLETDPGEQRNLAPYRPKRVRELSARLEAWRREWTTRAQGPSDLSAEERRGLEALGYTE